MFIYFRDSFITKQDTYRWAEPFKLYREGIQKILNVYSQTMTSFRCRRNSWTVLQSYPWTLGRNRPGLFERGSTPKARTGINIRHVRQFEISTNVQFGCHLDDCFCFAKQRYVRFFFHLWVNDVFGNSCLTTIICQNVGYSSMKLSQLNDSRDQMSIVSSRGKEVPLLSERVVTSSDSLGVI